MGESTLIISSDSEETVAGPDIVLINLTRNKNWMIYKITTFVEQLKVRLQDKQTESQGI